jgi:hypothetical protein
MEFEHKEKHNAACNVYGIPLLSFDSYEAIREWRRLHNDELHGLYPSPI